MVVNHLLTLDGRPTSRLAALRRTSPLLHMTSREAACTHGHMCACTHYLVFKEPECPAFLNTTVQPRRIPTERPFPSVLGEPSEVTTRCPGCQAPVRLADGLAWLRRKGEAPNCSAAYSALSRAPDNLPILRARSRTVNHGSTR